MPQVSEAPVVVTVNSNLAPTRELESELLDDFVKIDDEVLGELDELDDFVTTLEELELLDD